VALTSLLKHLMERKRLGAFCCVPAATLIVFALHTGTGQGLASQDTTDPCGAWQRGVGLCVSSSPIIRVDEEPVLACRTSRGRFRGTFTDRPADGVCGDEVVAAADQPRKRRLQARALPLQAPALPQVSTAAVGPGPARTRPGTATSRAALPRHRLIIPRLHLNDRLGTSVDAGPAFYPGSGRPGEPYTIAIAGHRTTHTRPFWSLNSLVKGDRITIISRGTRHVYLVTGSRVVAPTDWSVAGEQGRERLILTTCTPRFSARQRLVVFARVAAK
jgi:sortase A